MKFRTETYRKAVEEMNRRKLNIELVAEQHRESFYEICPKARLIDRQIQRTAILAARSVLAGANSKKALMELKEANLELQKQKEELLTAHNLTKADISPNYNCKKCNDSGYVDGFMCQCLKDLVKKMSFDELNESTPLKISGFEDYHSSYFDNFSEQEKRLMYNNYMFCRKYADEFSEKSCSMLFYGATGLGKTHLSLAIAKQVIEKGYGVVYGTVQGFVQTIEKERFSQDSDVKSTMESCDLLILDDLGVEFSSGYTQSIIYDVINTRIMTNKATIISTNLNPEQLNKRYGDRIISRFFGAYRALNFVGKDIRKIKQFG